jgi:hypothetical protein
MGDAPGSASGTLRILICHWTVRSMNPIEPFGSLPYASLPSAQSKKMTPVLFAVRPAIVPTGNASAPPHSGL